MARRSRRSRGGSGKRWRVRPYFRNGKRVSGYTQRRRAYSRGTYYARVYRRKLGIR